MVAKPLLDGRNGPFRRGRRKRAREQAGQRSCFGEVTDVATGPATPDTGAESQLATDPCCHGGTGRHHALHAVRSAWWILRTIRHTIGRTGRDCVRPTMNNAFAAVTHRLRVPEVVVLAHYDGMPGTTVPFSRRNIYKRDRYTCQYCGKQPADGRPDDRSCRAPRPGRRFVAGRIACWLALTAIVAKQIGLPSRPACGCGIHRNDPLGVRSIHGMPNRSRAGHGSWARRTGT